MKKLLSIGLLLSGGFMGFSCAQSNVQTESELPKTELKESNNLPKVGGWQNAEITNPQVIKAAKFAADQLQVIYSKILDAQQQVVAGCNYRIRMEVISQGKTKKIDVLVWEKAWENFYQLTKWEEIP